ncbi:hypothetical protein [Nostoc sp. CHAB 5715]|uniref:hypothetical protein n=1 Tax=Nostoc sp. CHAB 5715 TaxID=2780400 RepID=UPI001E5BC57C|nr:hypothetical protein [Nostoc sp. CHAB 5715]MCC5624057.1 hypothetical protein [Nostoc sp. CHAB 5715]
MDIRKSNPSKDKTQADKQATKAKFKGSTVQQASAAVMLPPTVAAKLSHLSTAYGLPLDLGKVALNDVTPETINATRKIVEMLDQNSKLLPELMKLAAKLFKAEIKLAEFHKNLTKAALKHQEKIDKETAEIFLAMAGYKAKASKLEHRTNTRNQLIDKRSQAYEQYYQTSVFGNEARVIDAEFQVLASNNKILSESKTKRVAFNKERRQQLQSYVDKAFAH